MCIKLLKCEYFDMTYHGITQPKWLSQQPNIKAVSYTHLDVYKRQPEMEMPNKKAKIILMREAQITSLINGQSDQMLEVNINTTEHMVLKELWYKTEETYFTSKKTVLHLSLIHI